MQRRAATTPLGRSTKQSAPPRKRRTVRPPSNAVKHGIQPSKGRTIPASRGQAGVPDWLTPAEWLTPGVKLLTPVAKSKPRIITSDIYEIGSDVLKVHKAGGLKAFYRTTQLREAFKKTVVPVARAEGPESMAALRAQMQFVQDETAKRPGAVDDLLKVIREDSTFEKAARLLGPAGAVFGSVTLYNQSYKSTLDKVDAGMTVLSIGGGVLETVMLTSLAVPGGEVVVAVIGAGVGAYELGRLTADFVTAHEAQITQGLRTASGTLRAHPEIDPGLAAVAALASRHGDIVAAGEALAKAYERDGAAALKGVTHAYSVSVSEVGHLARRGADLIASESGRLYHSALGLFRR